MHVSVFMRVILSNPTYPGSMGPSGVRNFENGDSFETSLLALQ